MRPQAGRVSEDFEIFEFDFEDLVLPSVLQNRRHRPTHASMRAGRGPDQRHIPASDERQEGNYTIFEGTSEIQRLIIARAISGPHDASPPPSIVVIASAVNR